MIDNTKEYIACSAIYYDDGIYYNWMNTYGIKTGFVVGGFRHPLIMSIEPTILLNLKRNMGWIY